LVTTYRLTTTLPGGEPAVRTGLTREQAMWALTDLMYGTWDEDAQDAPAARDGERVTALAA
jgi:hypothetical protein